MPSHRSTVEVIPSARRLINSLRDVGYDFCHAVADLIDNSIAAAAGLVDVQMHFDGEESWVRVADNGRGMNGTLITEAMRFGSERDYEVDDLGKFGLGLKTASLSQCRKITVASRMDPSARRIEVRQWDLNHVEKTNRWEILDLPSGQRPDHLLQPLENTTGTVVLWEDLDRVLGYKIPWGDRARNGFFQTTDDLYAHLAMVFHRFLSGEARRRRKLKITINGTPVEPWDPFARDEERTIRYAEQEFDVQTDDGRGLVRYVGYALPAQNQFSLPSRFNYYGGPARWNQQQGLYVHRSDRLIQSGGWSYLRTADEHTKLARVSIDFLPDLDSAFELNISKARVGLPASLRDQLKPHIEQLAKKAREVYDHGSRAARPTAASESSGYRVTPGVSDSPSQPQEPVVPNANEGPVARSSPPASTTLPPLARTGEAIADAATAAGQLGAFNQIKGMLRQKSPEVADELGW